MATTVRGALTLPDGAAPYNAVLYFTRRTPGAPASLPGPISVQADASGTFSVDLDTETNGTAYAVRVEHWSAADNRLVSVVLPTIVTDAATDGTTVTLADIAAVSTPANTTTTHAHKRGDTIDWPVQMVDEYGRAVDLTGSTVASALEGPDGVTRTLTCTVDDATSGLIIVGYSATSSANLPLGPHRWDVRITTGTVVVRTPTSTITIIDEVTP